MRWPLIFALLLIASPAFADITGPARVIDGDTIDIAGERADLLGWAQRVPLLLIRTALTPRGYQSMALSCRVFGV